MRNLMIALAIFLSCCFLVKAETENAKSVSKNSPEPNNSILAHDSELYKLCSLYCYATRHEDGEVQLKQKGWKIENVKWDKTFKEIENEIKSDTTLENCRKVTPLSQRIDSVNDSEIKSLYDNYEKTCDETINVKQHFGFILGKKKVDSRNVYVIAFRGTDDISSWIFTDFVANKTEFFPNTKIFVHTGFEKYRQACQETAELKEFIDAYKKELNKGENPLLLITGHSLGGAAAVLESAYLVYKEKIPYENIKLITSGEATPGKISFVEHFARLDYTTFINTADPIPYILANELFNYNRLKGKVFYFTDKKWSIAARHLIETYKKNIDKGNYEEKK